MALVKTYSPEKIDVIVNGFALSGFTTDSIVTIERSEDAFELYSGADGEIGRSKNPNRSGTITIMLASTSESNETLSALAIADELSGIGTFPILVKDNNGTTLAASGEAWVQKIAPSELARTINDREWIIQCARLDVFVGGSA